MTSNPVYEFNIHAAPGMDAQDIAQEVARQIKEIERKRDRATRTLAIDY
ncbi:hypothetical protein QYZ44_17735 [Vibrio parahaemolyticus]|nr:hypothetical protein [Vibrio parahaemolyticus]MDN4711026.1 hypothetical protein [Vibrio parahaemolyticus]MDN4711053.1 hypothetical protein [Vibrio parahaemolyticus]